MFKMFKCSEKKEPVELSQKQCEMLLAYREDKLRRMQSSPLKGSVVTALKQFNKP